MNDFFERLLAETEAERVTVETGWHTLHGLQPSYSAVAEGKPLALIGSACCIEIAVRGGSAAEKLDLSVGSRIIFRM